MLRRTAQPPAIVLQPGEVARRNQATWTMRTGTFRAHWTLENIVAGDGLNLHIAFAASVEVLADSTERTLFVETFGRPDSVAEDDLRRHLEPALHTAAGQLAAGEPAASLVDSAFESRWVDTLLPAVEAVAFGCGLRVSPPVQLNVTSDELDHRRREEARRAQAEREAQGRLTAAKHTTALLREWQSVHEQWPAVSPGELLGRLAPADQAGAVSDVLAATGAAPVRFWIVAGNSLIQLDWDVAPAEPAAIQLPAALGPLRSVRVAGDQLLIGAQRGVWVLNAADGAVRRKLIVADLVSEHGFSAAVDLNGTLWASHRDAGLVAWGPTGDEPIHRIGIAELGGPPTALNGSGVAVDARWLSIQPDQSLKTHWTGSSPIVAMLTGDGLTDVITRDGTWTQFDSHGELIATRATLPRVTAAARLPWLWSHRLLVLSDDANLHCFGLNDDIVTQYAAPQGVGRAIASLGGKLLAMTADRNSLIGWTSAEGRRPLAIPISSIARARVTDLAGQYVNPM